MGIPYLLTAQSFFFSRYDQHIGLNNPEIFCLVQDKYGFMWLGTDQGLIKYDGRDFVTVEYFYDPDEDPVYDLMFDRHGKLWIAGRNTLTSFDGVNFKSFSITNADSPYHCFGLIETEDDGILFFYGPKSMFKLIDDELVDLSVEMDQIEGDVIDVAGRHTSEVCVLSTTGQLWMFLNNEFVKILQTEQNNGDLIVNSEKKIFRTTNGHLTQFHPEKKGFERLAEIEIPDGPVHDLVILGGDSYVVAYDHKTTYFEGAQSIELNSANGFYGGPVKLFFIDIEGSLWIITHENELFQYVGNSLTYLEFSKDQSFMPSSFIVDKKDQLIISYFGKGLDVFNGENIVKINQEKGLVSNYVRCVSRRNGEYWIITARGITIMQENILKNLTTSDGLPHNYCFYACPDPSGRMWVGTEGGVGIYDDNSFVNLTVEDGLMNNRIKYILPYQDEAMLLMSDNCVDKYDQGKISQFLHQELKDKEVLNTMVADATGNLWIGSDINGLIYYDQTSGRINYMNQQINLPFTRVRTLIFYNENRLCVGTERGIYFLEISTNGKIKSLHPVGLETGFPDFEVVQNATLKISDRIYFGTSIGVVIFNPDNLRETTPIPVNITGIMIEFRETDWIKQKQSLNTWFALPSRPVLDYNQNDLQINFKGITLKSADKLWYRYQLVEYDQSWSTPDPRESVLYANLSPGKYTFNVTASYDGFNWTQLVTNYNFVITPPFWRTWWFYLLVFAFMMVGFVIVNNYRIKTRINQLLLIEKLNKEEYEKIQKKVAMDFHDEVGNHLTSISMLVQLIKNGNWKIPADLEDLLHKIDLESKNLFLGTKDFIWSIDPKNNNLREVFYKIRDYGDEVFDNSSIQFQVSNGFDELTNIKLPAGFTRQIVLIFKEAINNAKAHAGCQKVGFSIDVDADKFKIKLTDDGIGFNVKEIDYYNGLKKMKLRGEKIKGELEFHSGPDKGTEVVFKVNLNKNRTS